MGFTYSSAMMMILLLVIVSFLQCESDNHLRLKLDDHGEKRHGRSFHDHSSTPHMDDIKDDDPELNLFFHYSNLKPGNKMLVYFATKDPSTTPRLLPREQSDSIPFSTSEFDRILGFFEFSKDSEQAIAMESTLRLCEFPPIKGEAKFCATSIESMLDSVRRVFGLNSRFDVVATKYLSRGEVTPLQNYTVVEVDELMVSKMMACHMLPYPYAVYYCHGQAGDNKLYKVLLEGDDDDEGGRQRVEAAGICHMDTSQWDPNHVSFRVLKTLPGASPVCHFFPADNLVWVEES